MLTTHLTTKVIVPPDSAEEITYHVVHKNKHSISIKKFAVSSNIFNFCKRFELKNSESCAVVIENLLRLFYIFVIYNTVLYNLFYIFHQMIVNGINMTLFGKRSYCWRWFETVMNRNLMGRTTFALS